MTKEDRDLLFKDLCARLPYGVKYVRSSWNYDTDQELPVIETLECAFEDGYINHSRVYTVYDIKPYLFPLSSMTEEQKVEYQSLCKEIPIYDNYYGELEICDTEYVDNRFSIDWLNKNHFDYRGLIPMGLAIDATGLGIYD